MKNLLKKHQVKKIRFKEGDFIFYNPTDEQLEEIKKIIEEVGTIDNKLGINVNLGFKEIRYIVKELTNIGDEIDNYTDDELLNLIDKGDLQVKLLFGEIEKFINEVTKEIMFVDNQKLLNSIDNCLFILNSTNNEKKIKRKMNKFLKKNNMNLDLDKLEELKDNPDDMIKAINEMLKR